MISNFDGQRLYKQYSGEGDQKAYAPSFQGSISNNVAEPLGHRGIYGANQAGHRPNQQETLDIAAVA
jgi:hypothetical protein